MKVLTRMNVKLPELFYFSWQKISKKIKGHNIRVQHWIPVSVYVDPLFLMELFS